MASQSHEVPGSESLEVLQLKLRGLQEQAVRTTGLVRRLALLAAVLVALLILLTVSLHLYRVMQYAQLRDVTATLDEKEPKVAKIRFWPMITGKVDFTREDQEETVTIADYVIDHDLVGRSGKLFMFGGKDRSFTLNAQFREGLFLTTRKLLGPGARP